MTEHSLATVICRLCQTPATRRKWLKPNFSNSTCISAWYTVSGNECPRMSKFCQKTCYRVHWHRPTASFSCKLWKSFAAIKASHDTTWPHQTASVPARCMASFTPRVISVQLTTGKDAHCGMVELMWVPLLPVATHTHHHRGLPQETPVCKGARFATTTGAPSAWASEISVQASY